MLQGLAPGGQHLFALPGNPVSTFTCYYRYILPWLKKQLGMHAEKQLVAQLTGDYIFEKELTYFLQVKISQSADGTLLATPIKGKGSSDLANLCHADGILELPEEKQQFSEGESFPPSPDVKTSGLLPVVPDTACRD